MLWQNQNRKQLEWAVLTKKLMEQMIYFNSVKQGEKHKQQHSFVVFWLIAWIGNINSIGR